jgi:hypothetical protein
MPFISRVINTRGRAARLMVAVMAPSSRVRPTGIPSSRATATAVAL